jgi:hypothetical protein
VAQKPINYIVPTLLLLIFIGFGDKFLPQPLSGASWQTRTTINQWLLGLFPNKEFKKLNEQREKEIEDLEKGQRQKE